jgi:predicted permease
MLMPKGLFFMVRHYDKEENIDSKLLCVIVGCILTAISICIFIGSLPYMLSPGYYGGVHLKKVITNIINGTF